MDETEVRALLDRLAEDDPPSQVNIAAARARGRRWRRWRWTAWSATSLTAVAAATAVALGGVIPLAAGGPGAGQPASAPRRARVTPRSTFNVLVPYASFGWLPAGFSVSGGIRLGAMPSMQPHEAMMGAGLPAAGHLLGLTVSTAGTEVPGPKQGLTRAPAVNGDPAFWTSSGGLTWEYARRSWAALETSVRRPAGPARLSESWLYRHARGWVSGVLLQGHPATVQSAHTRALLHKVAAGVRYGVGAPSLFGFQLTGLPGWRAESTGFTVSGGRLVGTDLSLRSASTPFVLSVAVSPAATRLPGAGPDSCEFPGHKRQVTLGGAQWGLWTWPPADYQKILCNANYHGMRVVLALNSTSTRPAGSAPRPDLATLISVFRHLRLLGPDPANWTTSPLG